VEILLIIIAAGALLLWFSRGKASPQGHRTPLPPNQSLTPEINRRETEEVEKIQDFMDSLVTPLAPGLEADERNSLLASREKRLLDRCGIDMRDPDELAILELIIRAGVFDLFRPMPPLSAYSGIKKMVERRLRDESPWESNHISNFMETAHTYALLGGQTASFSRLKLIDAKELAQLAIQHRDTSAH